MSYLLLKWIHVLSSTVLFGTGIGSAYYMLMASLSRDVRAIAVVVRHVVLADWIFTTTAIIVQPVTGLWMVHLLGMRWTTPWIAWSIALYFVAGACWLPVVWLQYRMRAMASEAVEKGQPLPALYGRYLRYWVALGIPAFVALVAVFYLMVAKPS
jgi:uncharacterized membrane protein